MMPGVKGQLKRLPMFEEVRDQEKYSRGKANVIRALLRLEIYSHKVMIAKLGQLRVPFYLKREVKAEIEWREAQIHSLGKDLKMRKATMRPTKSRATPAA